MWAWPNLELTDNEREYVRIYKSKNPDKPGVLRRIYRVILNDPAQPAKNLPLPKLSGQIQIARRSRVFAINFSGNTDRWRLNISNASGTQYTNKSPRSQQDPVVSSMVPGNTQNALALGGLVPPLDPTAIAANLSDGIGPSLVTALQITDRFFLNTFQPAPLLIDPNWLLLPNETLIFTGTPIHITLAIGKAIIQPNLVLKINVHVWEFPIMGTADISTREAV